MRNRRTHCRRFVKRLPPDHAFREWRIGLSPEPRVRRPGLCRVRLSLTEQVFDYIGTMYAELHCHTNFSFLDGASHPEDLVDGAVELGYDALAITDHNGFYGVSCFWQAAREVGLPVVYGVEVGFEADPIGPSDPVEAAEQWDQSRHARVKGGQGRLRRGRSVRVRFPSACANHECRSGLSMSDLSDGGCDHRTGDPTHTEPLHQDLSHRPAKRVLHRLSSHAR